MHLGYTNFAVSVKDDTGRLIRTDPSSASGLPTYPIRYESGAHQCEREEIILNAVGAIRSTYNWVVLSCAESHTVAKLFNGRARCFCRTLALV